MYKPKPCSIEGCDRDATGNGWCGGHTQRAKRSGGDPGPAEFRRRPNSEPPPCSVSCCDQPANARGFCKGHYQRWYAGRDVNVAIVPQKAVRTKADCRVSGCDEQAKAKGWCNRHYQRWWRTGDPGPADARRYGLIEECSVDGCERDHRTAGFCDLHYRRFRRGVRPDSLKFTSVPKPHDLNSYRAAHEQLRQLRGRAADQTCPCGQPARQWAYQHNDPHELVSEMGHPYSFKSLQCYEAMCQSCHNILDRDPDRRAEAMRSAT